MIQFTKADRFFGVLKPEINEKKENGELFTREEYKAYTKKRCKELNEKNNLKHEKYKAMNVRVSLQPDKLDTLDFKGCRTSLWLRSKFKKKKAISFTNYISPFSENKIRKVITKDRLNQLKIQKTREHKSRNKSTDAPNKEDKTFDKMPKRLEEFNQKVDWMDEYSDFFLSFCTKLFMHLKKKISNFHQKN